MITKDNVKKFKKAYNKAVKDGKAVFKFEGQDVLVSYAKYMIEHLNRIGL